MNQTKKDIKDFLISKDIKFSSIFEIDKLPGGSSNETWIIKYKNDSSVEKIVLRRHFHLPLNSFAKTSSRLLAKLNLEKGL